MTKLENFQKGVGKRMSYGERIVNIVKTDKKLLILYTFLYIYIYIYIYIYKIQRIIIKTSFQMIKI